MQCSICKRELGANETFYTPMGTATNKRAICEDCIHGDDYYVGTPVGAGYGQFVVLRRLGEPCQACEDGYVFDTESGKYKTCPVCNGSGRVYTE